MSSEIGSSFLAVLTLIENHARSHFRDIGCADTRDDLIAESIALSWKWFLRLAERGKDATAFPVVLASFAVRAARNGRRVCGLDKAKDVLSERAQKRHGFTITRLDRRGHHMSDAFIERFEDDTRTPVADQAAFRIDWPEFFQALPDRKQRIAEFLSLGHSAKHAASKFGVSLARVTQLRQEIRDDWRALQGESA